ncbi:MAG: glycosyltransferase [Thermoguttaceae bacterium]|nr:glycosyltransferase [Thermoguttaceae bacterium]
MTLVTILIPVWNTPARMLGDCWRSILAQTWTNWQLVVVDDGSSLPETLEVLKKWAQDRKVHLIRQEHLGLSQALNRGLEAAQTELVARMDADDLMVPDRLEKQVQYMLQHPEVDILGGQIEAFDDNSGQPSWRTHHPLQVNPTELQQAILEGQTPWFLNHSAVMYRRSRILALGGYDLCFGWAQDFDLWLRALRAGYIIRNLPDVVLRYRLHGGQSSKNSLLPKHDHPLIERAKRLFCKKMPERIFLVGYPGDMGGAGTECWHSLLLWRRYNLQVVCVPTWGSPPCCWRQRVTLLGYPTFETQPDQLAQVAGLPGSIVVSFCNSQFLAHADRVRALGCRIVWVGCMCWLFEAERRHYEKYGPFDAYVFQSHYQMDKLLPQLASYGVQPEQCHLVRAAFMTEEWPFRPKPHKKGEPLWVGRISRPAPDKFHPKTWWIYERIPHPVRARIMAWSPEVQQKIGPPPPWAEVLPSRTETAQQFFSKLHVMLQVNGGAEENWPRSGLEAMAAGVPIVAPNQWGWPEMIRHGLTGFLANTEDELAYYAAQLAYDEGLRQFMAQTARRHLEENLARPEVIWHRWQTVFASLL